MNTRKLNDIFVPSTDDVTFTVDDILRLQNFTEQLLYLSGAISDGLKKFNLNGNN